MTTQAYENNLTGKCVRLAVLDPEKDGELWAKWHQDSEFQQLLDWGPANVHSPQETREWIEKDSNHRYEFSIHILEGDQPIGFCEVSGINWTSGDCWIGIGIGDRDYWGKGCGTEAMNLMLRFIFEELNLKRVSLDVFEYNERAVKCYEKCGFKHEGRLRQLLNRFDRRWDMIFMGILREEWEEKNTPPPAAGSAQPHQEQEWRPSATNSAPPTLS